MFTGKNKENFEKWLYYNNDLQNSNMRTLAFRVLPFSMQSGVYLEYLDSVGYRVEIYVIERDVWNFFCEFNDGAYEMTDKHTTRQEALTEAFKKADELINNI